MYTLGSIKRQANPYFVSMYKMGSIKILVCHLINVHTRQYSKTSQSILRINVQNGQY